MHKEKTSLVTPIALRVIHLIHAGYESTHPTAGD